jgi:hypothetical protein
MITLELELSEVNGVLAALGQIPFAQVAGLISKIQAQASPQVQINGTEGTEALEVVDAENMPSETEVLQ